MGHMTQQHIAEEAKVGYGVAARDSFDTLDTILIQQERRLRAEWRALQQAKTAANSARHASACAAGVPHIAGALGQSA